MPKRPSLVRCNSDNRRVTEPPIDEGFMRPPSRLTADEILAAEEFAEATGIGPLFDLRPPHHGQHSWCCAGCNTYRTEQSAKVRQIRQPWEPEQLAA